jgi:hypothetical protein
MILALTSWFSAILQILAEACHPAHCHPLGTEDPSDGLQILAMVALRAQCHPPGTRISQVVTSPAIQAYGHQTLGSQTGPGALSIELGVSQLVLRM